MCVCVGGVVVVDTGGKGLGVKGAAPLLLPLLLSPHSHQ